MTENGGARNWFFFGARTTAPETIPAMIESRAIIIHERTPLVSQAAPELGVSKSYAKESSSDIDNTRIRVDDDYIVSLIQKTPSFQHNDDTIMVAEATESERGYGGKTESRGTTWGQTVIHLVKGYVGCGILSLPWAISQLGIPLGLLAILFMAMWTSYNCWTVTKIKQYIENRVDDDNIDENDFDEEDNNSNKCTPNGEKNNDETSSRRSGSMAGTSIASASNATTTTYPDVGEWAYGANFQSYVSLSSWPFVPSL